MEFGLLLPLLVMIVFGIVEFGTAYNRSQGMEAAVREGARFASTGQGALAQIQARVRNALQADDGGSGFPAAGGTLVSDVVVTVIDDDHGTLSPGDIACDPGGGAMEVTVTARITGEELDETDRRDAYGLSLPLIPGSPFPLDLSARAVFPCVG